MNGLALCAGIGGIELGLRLAEPSYRTLCYVEREAYAAAVLATRMEEASLPPALIWDDVSTFNGLAWRGLVDVISAGYPCQPFSCAGKREGVTDERWIWPEIARILGEVHPQWAFFENVPGHLRNGFGIVLRDLATGGYDAEWDVFSAAGCGAPHLRKRLFILAYSNGTSERERYNSNPITGHEGTVCLRRNCADTQDASTNTIDSSEDVPNPICNEYEGGSSTDAGQAAPLLLTNAEGPRLEGQDTAGQSSGQRDGRLAECDWWAVEPELGRVADGIAYRVDRLRAIGNGVVPIVAAKAWQVLKRRIEKGV